jgi:hypothetical protein
MRPNTKAARNKSTQPDFRYRQLLAQHILRFLWTGGDSNFCSIVKRAGGAYPSDVLSVLRQLTDQQKVVSRGGSYSLPSSAGPGVRCFEGERTPERAVVEMKESAQTLELAEYLGEPHPADYDWRYSSSSLAQLSRRVLPVVQASEKVALLGCPTLFPLLAGLDGRVMLLDRSASAVEGLKAMGFRERVFKHDLFEPLGEIEKDYALVIADPPWYPPFHKAFIVRANELLCDGGLLLLSILPWLTRPGAIDDRAEILEFGARAGFDVASFEEGILGYQSPGFERASLAIQGIDCGEWRSGDLCTLRKINQAGTLATPRPSDEPQWEEFRLGRRKVMVRRRKENGVRGFRAEFVDGSAVLKSVSRRSPVRAKIDIWTSDNIAYMVSGLNLVREALSRLEAGDTPEKVAVQLQKSHGLSPGESRELLDLLLNLKAHNSNQPASTGE